MDQSSTSTDDLSRAGWAHWVEFAKADIIRGDADVAERMLRDVLRSTCGCSQCNPQAVAA